MKDQESNIVNLLSGPAGVGKSTTSKELVKQFKNSAYISGDYISHMHVNGRKKPWESKEEVKLIWDNILSITKNFLQYGNDVVIDYVTFPLEAKWLNEKLQELNTQVKYVVLWADNETLIKRNNMRKIEYKMGERCLIIAKEFKEAGLQENHILDISKNNLENIPTVLSEIINNPKYILL